VEPAGEPATTPAMPSGPGVEPVQPETPSANVEQPLEFQPPAGTNLTFRVDPPIGDQAFFQWAAERFAQRVPGFSLVTGPGSPDLDAPAWPPGADFVGGIQNEEAFTYTRLPQLVAAKLVRPLDSWFEWTTLAPVLVDTVRVGGRVYGVPIGGFTPVLYFNRELVREPPRVWADIAALAAENAQTGGDALAN